jgi:hypothetical protein
LLDDFLVRQPSFISAVTYIILFVQNNYLRVHCSDAYVTESTSIVFAVSDNVTFDTYLIVMTSTTEKHPKILK